MSDQFAILDRLYLKYGNVVVHGMSFLTQLSREKYPNHEILIADLRTHPFAFLIPKGGTMEQNVAAVSLVRGDKYLAGIEF